MNLPIDIITGLAVIAGVAYADTNTTASAVQGYAALVEKFGIMAALLAYFLVRDYLRNKVDQTEKIAQTAKLDSLNVYVRDILSKQLATSTTAIKANTKTHDHLLDALEHKSPCLSKAAHERKVSLKASIDDTDRIANT